MDAFRKKLRARQFMLICGTLLSCVAIFFGRRLAGSGHVPDFIAGFQMGLCLALVGVLVFFLQRTGAALENPDKMKKLYIAETDERALFIRQQTGSTGMLIVMFGLVLATCVAGFFSSTVFFTLLGACLFVTLVFGGLKVYFKNRY